LIIRYIKEISGIFLPKNTMLNKVDTRMEKLYFNGTNLEMDKSSPNSILTKEEYRVMVLGSEEQGIET
jgi:hypothetical protein